MKHFLPGVRHKTYQRSKARRYREGKTYFPPVLAAGTIHNVPITGPFEGRDEWLVEKVVIATEDESVMAAPTTFIKSSAPMLPIANPSTCPWYIRAGDVVSKLHDYFTYVDSPKMAEEEKYAASTEALARVIDETLRAQDPDALPSQPVASDDKLDKDENWGPKTAALAGEFEDGSAEGDVAKLVNLGLDVPDDIRLRIDNLLHRNSAAFGVGGHLCHVKEKAPIPLKPDTQPISMPMYSASPAKRDVINKQMDLWFERDVIEPSTSPCVVVYCNGKLCLVVDYCQ